MNKTFLIGSKPTLIFLAHYCQGLKITSLSIDYNLLPFTAGYVVDVNKTYLDIEVIPHHQTDIDRQVIGIYRFDPVQMRLAYGPNTYSMLQLSPMPANTSFVSPGILQFN